MIRKSRFQTLRPACVRFRRMRPRSVQQSLGCRFHRDRWRHWARCPIVLLPPDLPGRHAAYAEQRASPRTFLEMQSTWRTSQCPAGVATGHGADKLQTAAPNAGLGSRSAQSPFSPLCLSTKYPQVTFHSLFFFFFFFFFFFLVGGGVCRIAPERNEVSQPLQTGQSPR